MSTHHELVAGDVVFDVDSPDIMGIVMSVTPTSVDVAWEDGARSGGPGLVAVVAPREPRANVVVPIGARSALWWNREQAVKAVLRRAGIGS